MEEMKSDVNINIVENNRSKDMIEATKNNLNIKGCNNYNIKIDSFEGPLDLLLYLVEKEEIEIEKVNILQITEQYLEYIKTMQELDLDIASEFIVMASQLIYLKSKQLLPAVEGENEDISEEDFLKVLLEYKRYKDIQEEMFLRYNKFSKRMVKLPSKIVLSNLKFEQTYDIKELSNSYEDVLEKISFLNNNKVEKLEETLNRKNFSIFSKVKEIYKILFNKGKFNFNKVFLNKERSDNEKITAFLSILELAKKNRVKIMQNEIYRGYYHYW